MRKYEGKGTLSFPTIPEVKGIFNLTFQENGKTTLEFTPEGGMVVELLNLPSVPGRFSGESFNSEYSVNIDRIYFGKGHMNGGIRLEFNIRSPVKISYQPLLADDQVEFFNGLSSLLFWAEEATQRGLEWTRDTLRVILDSREVILRHLQDYEKIEDYLMENGGVRVTCDLIVKGNYRDIDSLREFSRDVQFLCSLASGNYVTLLYEDIYKKDILSETTLFPLKTYPFSNRQPLIDTTVRGTKGGTTEFKEYLETTYPQYVKHKVSLGLPYVIEFFTTSKIYSPIELQYLLTTTTLECLECYFRRWQNLRSASLRSKTSKMLNFFNTTYNASELGFTNTRNSIVHEGRFPLNCDGFKALLELRNLLDRLFLAILGYHGRPYHNIVLNKKEYL